MLLNPKSILSNGWVKFDETVTNEFQQKCLQPNAIDFTVDRVWEIDSTVLGVLTEDSKSFKPITEIFPVDGVFTLQHGKVYDCMSTMYVTVPEGTAAFLTIRSTLNRLGVRMNSGIYDSLFQGNLGYTLTPHAGDVQIGQGTRVGQIAFHSSDSNGGYAGGYNTKRGEHWTDAIKNIKGAASE